MMMGWHGVSTAGSDLITGMLVAGVAIMLFFRLRHHTPWVFLRRPHAQLMSALNVAELRYARGEISRDEFLDIVNDLNLADAELKFKRKNKRSS
jgi:uncharacterized membrane protein